VMTDDVANLLYKILSCPQAGHDCSGNGRPLGMLILGGSAVVFPLGFMNADIVQIGGTQNHGRIAPFIFYYLFSVSGHIGGMADPPEVTAEITLHFHSHPIFQKIFFLSKQRRRQIAQTLVGMRAVDRTPEIHPGVDELVAAAGTFSCGIVPEKFHLIAAPRAWSLKYGPGPPKTRILSRAFHGFFPHTVLQGCKPVQ
jgi:hypothetical protein